MDIKPEAQGAPARDLDAPDGISDEKASVNNSSSLDTEQVSAQETTQNEKHNDLRQQTTATSNHGQPVHRIRTREDGTEYPTGMKLVLISLALCLSVFLMALGAFCHKPPDLCWSWPWQQLTK